MALVPSGLSEKDRLRAAVTIQFDRAVERILAATTPDDMVILTGDNSLGTTPGLRGTKGSIWEGGIRVPFLIRAPGRLAAGRTNSTAVRLADLLPTILDFAGLPIPGGLDGQSLLGAVPREPAPALRRPASRRPGLRRGAADRPLEVLSGCGGRRRPALRPQQR